MDILILGGSYFAGLAFAEHAFRAGHRLTVLNRGSRPLGSENIREYHADRRDEDALERFPQDESKPPHFDALVDFCGYQEGDIRRIAEHLRAAFDQYIFVSTIDVLRHGTGELLREDSPYEDRDYGGEAGEYIRGKIALERELAEQSQGRFAYTILRPSILFGPGNYAPRENLYFQWIEKAGQILSPSDATGRFGFVYVEDAARAALACCANPNAYGRTFHLCGTAPLTYEDFEAALREATGRSFARVPVPLSQIAEQNLPLPFPLTIEESAACDGSAICGLQLPDGSDAFGSYTAFPEALRETWEAYLH